MPQLDLFSSFYLSEIFMLVIFIFILSFILSAYSMYKLIFVLKARTLALAYCNCSIALLKSLLKILLSWKASHYK